MRRFISSLLLLLGTTSTANATSPEFPICDADDAGPGFVVDRFGGVGPDCAVRWIAPDLRPGGVTFELWRDGARIATQTDADATDELQPQRRHECDGSIVDTHKVLASYAASFPDALDGDEIRISDASGRLGTTYVDGSSAGICPTLDWATDECQVCAPDAPAYGCLSASPSSGGSGAPWLVVLVGLAIALVARRRVTMGG
jgi:MYXO-CTERM domain-containing protein